MQKAFRSSSGLFEMEKMMRRRTRSKRELTGRTLRVVAKNNKPSGTAAIG